MKAQLQDNNIEQKFFVMSKRYNKKTLEDFGLIQTKDPEVFKLPSDSSLWKRRSLYDFGWGKENGFYRIPLPKFDGLVKLILHSKLEENKYGAAALILDDFGEELLLFCEEILKDRERAQKYLEFFRILHLEIPINRSMTWGKTLKQINQDSEKWKKISDQINNLC